MAGLGIRFEDVLKTQLVNLTLDGKNAEELADSLRTFYDMVFAIIRQEENDETASTQIGCVFDQLPDRQKEIFNLSKIGLEKYLRPWMRYALNFDPAPSLAAVRCPVLAINGEKDHQVLPKENLGRIEKALKEGGNQHYTIRELPGLNHLFQQCETGKGYEYTSIEETISPVALELISGWILEQIGGK
jgi:uncharacterized protein